MPPENLATGGTNFTGSSSPRTPTRTAHHSNTLEATPTATYLSPTGTATSMSPDDPQYRYGMYSPTPTPCPSEQMTAQRSPPDEFTLQYPTGTNHLAMDTWYNTTYVGNEQPVLTPNLGPPFEDVSRPPNDSPTLKDTRTRDPSKVTTLRDISPFSTWPGPTQDSLLRGFDPTDLHRFGLVNREWYQVSKSFQKRAYNRSKTLDHYFNEHEQKFLQLFQAKTGALLAGEPVDRFFARENNEGELVIIVSIVDVMALGCWLAFNGFRCDPRRNPQQSFTKTVRDEMHRVHETTDCLPASTCTFHFTKERCATTGVGPISVGIVSATCAPMEVVLNVPLSDGMCFFTHTNAIALFPYCSYVRKETLEITAKDDVEPHYCLNGSMRRKWVDSVHAIDALDRRSEFASHRVRFVGDDNCFIVALEVPPSVASIPDFVFITSWEIDYTMRDPSLKFEVIRGPSCRYYCIAQAEMSKWTAAGDLLVGLFHRHNTQWVRTHYTARTELLDGIAGKIQVLMYAHCN
ncbi:uncharacterized protein C8R40DRAFT_1066088 [Lentinula edodes]|uniref:uncharacterized protein n=1 Tax=Lentinula edodes TaxID=5353 RepID=UPI001E8D07B1|nr:uncharacterized protein C8R40DRAFT_1066088 [Lentinula edodes]KAH7879934.1 hypothetical protein C8R40DRAFT_1066088 [Lentinula edodes]